MAANLKYETLAALRREHDREKRTVRAARRLEEELTPFLSEMAPSVLGRVALALGDFVDAGTEVPARAEKEELADARRVLDQLGAAGVIDRDDRFLLFGVHVQGRRLSELARKLGISHEATKKRHARALMRIRRCA